MQVKAINLRAKGDNYHFRALVCSLYSVHYQLGKLHKEQWPMSNSGPRYRELDSQFTALSGLSESLVRQIVKHSVFHNLSVLESQSKVGPFDLIVSGNPKDPRMFIGRPGGWNETSFGLNQFRCVAAFEIEPPLS